jgi:hypothetical protein
MRARQQPPSSSAWASPLSPPPVVERGVVSEASKGKPLFVDGEQLGEGVVRLRNGKFLDPSGTVMSEGEIRELRRVIGLVGGAYRRPDDEVR